MGEVRVVRRARNSRRWWDTRDSLSRSHWRNSSSSEEKEESGVAGGGF